MSTELQNDEFYLKGDLGSVKIGSATHEITKVFKAKNGTTTLTIDPFPRSIEITIGKGWEVVTPKQIEQSKPTTK